MMRARQAGDSLDTRRRSWLTSAMQAARQLARVLDVLTPVLDIVRRPVESAEPPRWCQERGWDAFLAGLSDGELEACERLGTSGLAELKQVPAELLALGTVVARVTQLPRLSTPSASLPQAALRGVRARKREQLEPLLGALASLAESAGRIVDVGAGSGHLSRLAAELFTRETWALDRDADRLRHGSRRDAQRARSAGAARVHFVRLDVGQHELELGAHDLAVGLHACGELGDRLVLEASRTGCDLALISCCLQKTRAQQRFPLSRTAAGLELERQVLGLTNLTSRAQGVEAPLASNLAGREARLGLRYLLRSRGVELEPGAEMRGVNRRRARAGFEELARHALARWGLPAPTAAELRAHAARAERDYARMRRLALPRNMLARLVELAVVLDRAALLEESGHHALVAQFVEQRVTPRNTIIFASKQLGRLPAVVADQHA